VYALLPCSRGATAGAGGDASSYNCRAPKRSILGVESGTPVQSDFPGEAQILFWLVRNDNTTTDKLPIVAHKPKRYVRPTRQRDLLDDLFGNGGGHARSSPRDPIVVCTHDLSAGGAERQWIISRQRFGISASRDLCRIRSVDRTTRALSAAAAALEIPLVETPRLRPNSSFNCGPKPCRSTCSGSISAVLRAPVGADRGIRDDSSEVVFAQLDYPNIVAGLAAHIAGVPRFVMSFRNYNPSNFRIWTRNGFGRLPGVCRSERV